MQNNAPLKIGVAGLGTVGSEVVRRFTEENQHLQQRAGRVLQVTAVSAKHKNKKRICDVSSIAWLDDPAAMAAHKDVDVVVELIGGAEGPARALAEATLKQGKPFITANKALLATHGKALVELSEKASAPLYCEAAVAGGIPVIKTLREALAGNSIHEVFGILNGTCNFILTKMRDTGSAFADVLAEAQQLGYAEADPAFDIDGMDAGHKLAILSALAFGCPVDLSALKVEGIRNITVMDIAFADELKYRIKLLGVAKLTENGLLQRVSPYMVPLTSILARVDGVTNAVFIEANPVGPLILIGRGAGAGPTVSAVLSDVLDCATSRRASAFAVPSQHLKEIKMLPEIDSKGAFYIRAMVADQPGVLADIAAIMRDSSISIQSVLQKGPGVSKAVPIVLITHETNEQDIAKAMAAMRKLPTVLEAPCVIRILPH